MSPRGPPRRTRALWRRRTFPPAYNAVATTEMGQLSKLLPEFEARWVLPAPARAPFFSSKQAKKKLPATPPRRRNVRVFGVACASTVEENRDWIAQVEELESCKFGFPLIADADARIAASFGLVRHGRSLDDARDNLVPANVTVVSDIDMRMRVVTQHPSNVGRNFYEVLRAIDSLQAALFNQVVTPANWIHGADVFVQPKLSTVAARSLFPKGVIETRPWFRQTPNPE